MNALVWYPSGSYSRFLLGHLCNLRDDGIIFLARDEDETGKAIYIIEPAVLESPQLRKVEQFIKWIVDYARWVRTYAP